MTFRKYLLLEPSIDNNNVLILGVKSEVPCCTHNCWLIGEIQEQQIVESVAQSRVCRKCGKWSIRKLSWYVNVISSYINGIFPIDSKYKICLFMLHYTCARIRGKFAQFKVCRSRLTFFISDNASNFSALKCFCSRWLKFCSHTAMDSFSLVNYLVPVQNDNPNTPRILSHGDK